MQPFLSSSLGRALLPYKTRRSPSAYLGSLRMCMSSNSTPPEDMTCRAHPENPHIILLTLQRHERKNALGKGLVSSLYQAFDSVASNPDARVLLVHSAVANVFCAGADLKERRAMTTEEVPAFVRSLRDLFDRLAALPIPTIACIEGAAMGGGLEMALACDLRVAGERAVLSLPETKLAIIPGAGGTQRLPRLIGYPQAAHMLFTGSPMSATEALRIGLINQLVPCGKALDHSMQLAQCISENGPVAVRAAKEALRAALTGGATHHAQAMQAEEAAYQKVVDTSDRVEGLVAFAEKRKPNYQGR